MSIPIFPDAPNEARLHWIVPGRRAVVKERISFEDCMVAWIGQLEPDARTARFARWYGVESSDFSRQGIGDAVRWIFAEFPDLHRQRRRVVRAGGGNRLSVRTGAARHDYHPRLWSGALRTALAHDPTRSHGFELDAQQGEAGEVRNTGSDFIMGDVLEFPFHTVLSAAGLADYDGLAFDPQGSFLQGSSLRAAGGRSPAATPVHDNLMGMRFQALLDLGRGLFPTLRGPLYRGSFDEMAPRASGDGFTIHARGMMYAGVLSNATRRDDHWGINTMRWGHGAPGSLIGNLPVRESLDRLPADEPLTPGWSCSPCCLLLANFMLDLHDGGRYGRGSTHAAMVRAQQLEAGSYRGRDRGPAATIYQHMDWVEASEFDARLTEAAGAAVVDLDPLRRDLDRWIPRLQGNSAFSARAFDEAEAEGAFAGVGRATLNDLRSKREIPRDMMVSVMRKARSRQDDAERAAMRRFYQRLVRHGAEAFDALRQLQRGDAWLSVPVEPLEIDMENLPTARDAASTSVRRYDFWKIAQVRAQFARKRNLLDSADGGPANAARADLSDLFGDINILSLASHEWAVVKLRDPELLMESDELPINGFMAAYDPLSGVGCCEGSDRARSGQLYVFEATGSLARWLRGPNDLYNAFSAKPFRFEKIEGNRFTLQRNGRNIKVLLSGSSSANLQRMFRVRTNSLRAPYDGSRRFKPIRVHAMIRSAPGVNREGILGDVDRLYGTRAIPFPTFEEARAAYPLVSGLGAALDRAHRECGSSDGSGLNDRQRAQRENYLEVTAPLGAASASAAGVESAEEG